MGRVVSFVHAPISSPALFCPWEDWVLDLLEDNCPCCWRQEMRFSRHLLVEIERLLLLWTSLSKMNHKLSFRRW